jgi:hypothetical protein
MEGDVGERRIVPEIKRAVFGKGRDPEIDRRPGMQIGEAAELAGFGLPLIEVRRVVGGNGISVEKADPREVRRVVIVRDLEMSAELAEHQSDPVLVIDNLVEVGNARCCDDWSWICVSAGVIASIPRLVPRKSAAT